MFVLMISFSISVVWKAWIKLQSVCKSLSLQVYNVMQKYILEPSSKVILVSFPCVCVCVCACVCSWIEACVTRLVHLLIVSRILPLIPSQSFLLSHCVFLCLPLSSLSPLSPSVSPFITLKSLLITPSLIFPPPSLCSVQKPQTVELSFRKDLNWSN